MGGEGDGALAWAVLRRTAVYRDAWTRHAAGSGASAAPALAGLAGQGGSVEGLRLLSGGLVVRVECRSAAVQVRLREPGNLSRDAGISVIHPFGLQMPHSMRRLLDFWRHAKIPTMRSIVRNPLIPFASAPGFSA